MAPDQRVFAGRSERRARVDNGVLRREPVEADTPGMKTVLDASLVAWLGHLKVAAETRA